MTTKKHSLSDFKAQTNNANKHTERGLKQLDNAISEDGWITAITVCNDGETIDGTARLETAYEIFGNDVEPIIIRSRGDRPIIHIREDLPNANDPRAKKLSLSANRIAQIDLEWDVDILASLSEEIDLSGLFTDDELIEIIGGDDELSFQDNSSSNQGDSEEDFDRPPESSVRMVQLFLNSENILEFNQMIEALQKKYEVDTPTDCVMMALREVYENDNSV